MKFNKIANKGLVKTGKRMTQSTNPQFVMSSSFNQFSVNEASRKLMGVKAAGDEKDRLAYVRMWDVGEEEDGMRFFLTPGFYTLDGALEGAKIGPKGGFTVSPIWSAAQVMNPNVEGCPMQVEGLNGKDLERMGVVKEGTRSAFWRGVADLVPAYETEDGETVLDAVDPDTGKDNTPAVLTVFGDGDEDYPDGFPICDADGEAIELPVFAVVGMDYKPHTPKVLKKGEPEVVEEVDEFADQDATTDTQE